MKIPYSKPGESLQNKTGSWRTFKPVVSDKCVRCGMCVTFCPEIAIKLGEKKAEINYDYCKGCGICSNVCPVKAIEMVRE